MVDGFRKKIFDWSETLYTSVFEVAEYEFEIEIVKFKMEDPKWPTVFEKINLWFKLNFVHFGFGGRWIGIWNRNCEI